MRPTKAQKGSTRTNMSNTEVATAEYTATVAAQGANVAPEKASLKKGASHKKAAPTGRKAAKGAAPKKVAKAANKVAKPARAKATMPRAATKAAKILEMMARPKGATLGEIMKAAKWQAHSVRGYISIAGKKHGVKIESSKNEAGERLYRITK